VWEVISTVAVFGAAQIGLLLVVLGRMWSTQQEHGRRLEIVEAVQRQLATDVATLKGEVGA
jgi:hypothetical protein